jgi:hypothetical protein
MYVPLGICRLTSGMKHYYQALSNPSLPPSLPLPPPPPTPPLPLPHRGKM